MKSLLLICFLFSFSVQASFSELSLRYQSPFDMIVSFLHLYPAKLGEYNPSTQKCLILPVREISGLGGSDPASGLPISAEPGSAYVKWWQECLALLSYENLLRIQSLQPDASDLAKTFLGDAFLNELQIPAGNVAEIARILNSSWDNVAESASRKMIAHNIFRIIGPDEVIADFGVFKNSQEMSDLMWIQWKLCEATLVDQSRTSVTFQSMTQYFLQFLSFREEAQSY